ncbi:MAG TPA: hypothetical protein VJ885_02690 [Thermoanaerobaculia bacterium]|nr:hypothetical protein [Thermoanaerobaculia bacterium]
MKLLGAVCFFCGVMLGVGELGATPLHIAFDREGEGLAIAQAGVGLKGWGTGPRSLTLNVNGPVELAWLYWAGRELGCAIDPDSGVCETPEEPYKDQILRVDGVPVTGVVLGTEFQPVSSRGPILNLAYGVDVTEQVRAKGTGRLTFRLTDAEPERNLSDLQGAGLLVVYTSPGGPVARVIGLHGLDLAHGEDFTPGETQSTQAVTFAHGAAKRERQGEMVLFLGGGQAGRRPDRIEVRHNPTLVDRLDSSSGAEWDVERFPVHVPGQVLSTTAQVLSEPWGKNPDSFLWVMAALWLPLPEPEGCAVQVWNNRKEWTGTGVAPGQYLQDVFFESLPYGIGKVTLRGALRFRSESGLLGAAKALVRDGTAALLNATHLQTEYPYSRSQVIVLVDGALRSGDVVRMGELAELLREANGAGCR